EVAPADQRRLAKEHQEGGLKDVFGVVAVAQHALAKRQDHGAVPPEQALEGRLVLGLDKAIQELRVAQLPAVPADRVQQAVDQRLELSVAHERPSLHPSISLEPGGSPGCTLFSDFVCFAIPLGPASQRVTL